MSPEQEDAVKVCLKAHLEEIAKLTMQVSVVNVFMKQRNLIDDFTNFCNETREL